VDLADRGFWSSGLVVVERQLDAAEAAAREAGRIENGAAPAPPAPQRQ
jgi:oligoendopeptidase F